MNCRQCTWGSAVGCKWARCSYPATLGDTNARINASMVLLSGKIPEMARAMGLRVEVTAVVRGRCMWPMYFDQQTILACGQYQQR